VEEYLVYVKSRSERERMAEKKISGCFTGAYAVNPFSGKEIPIWISEYVLAGYGTGAIMAVPCGDERDFKFAQYFNIPITNIIGDAFNGQEANPTKDALLTNSDFLNGMVMRDALELVTNQLETLRIGKRKVNYRMRDAAFSRQRYWGEPFPIQWKNKVAIPLAESELPLLLPEVDSYSPGPEGEGPLANIPEWVARELETNTMPGYAGSSWYFLRYMDPHNEKEFCNRTVSDYWNQVDLYIGGTEHAVGHLLYSRMWTKALYDLGYIGHDEPYKKLVNQGMIQGSSRFVYRFAFTAPITSTNIDIDTSKIPLILISKGIIDKIRIERNADVKTQFFERINSILENLFPNSGIIPLHHFDVNQLHVDVNFVDGYELDIEAFRKWRNGEYANAEFILEDGSLYHSDSKSIYICGAEVEKMSKSKFNTVNPDDLVVKYGADTFRMYEMFLGPVEQSKPWDTKGIEGVHRFLKKLWRLFYDELKGKVWNEEKATAAELKILHKTIKKIEEDTERFSFNTAVSAFMVCVNELSDLKCNKREILEPLLIMLVPYAPHVTEELWAALGNATSILDAAFPVFDAKHIAESSKEYPVSINGKLRTTITLSLDIAQQEVEPIVLANETVQKWLDGKQPKKIIFVKGKMINVVV
jgi:leucyl-tRNA synthetase